MRPVIRPRGSSPRAIRSRLSAAKRARFSVVDSVPPAVCGVAYTFGSENTGCFLSGGSCSNTSSPAPPMLPASSAL